jgi:predicted nucleic acid-binding protein
MDPVHPPISKQVYLDVCALCRPFDDQQQMRIRLETAAVELIIANIRPVEFELIISPVHEAEIEAITDAEEGQQLKLLLEQLGTRLNFDLAAARQRAEQLTQQGLGAADAAHLAFAEQAGADFVTVDDRLLRQCHRVKPTVWYGTPPAYCEKENLR